MEHLKNKYLKLGKIVLSDFPGRMIRLVIVFAIYFFAHFEWSDFKHRFRDGLNEKVSAATKVEIPSFNINSIIVKFLQFF